MSNGLPGPANHFFGLMNARNFHRRPLEFLTSLAERFDQVAFCRLGPFHACLPVAPDVLREVLLDRQETFIKLPRHVNILRQLEGDSMFLSDVETWARRRRIMQTVFRPARMERYAETIKDTCISEWKSGDQLDLADALTELTLAVLGRTMFDIELTGQLALLREWGRVRSEVLIRDMSAAIQLPDWLPLPYKLRKRRMIRNYHNFIDSLIGERRNQAPRDDFLSAMLTAVDESGDGKGLSDREARDDTTLMFTAGFDTVATGLAWTLFLILSNPQVEEQVISEADSVHSDNSPLEASDKSAFLETVIKESLRIYPPNWCNTFRQASEDTKLGGYDVRRGTWVIISPYVAHHRAENFPQPGRFDPGRFSPQRVDSIPRFGYMPFSAGPRSCIGAAFAKLEISLIVATLLRRFRFRLLVDPETVKPAALLTLRPSGGLPVELTHR